MTSLTKVTLLILTLGTLFGCSTTSDPDKNKTATQNKEAQYATKLSANSTYLTGQDTLILNLPEQRPENVAVVSPNGNFFVIHSAEDNIFLIPPTQFKTSKTINIPLAESEGITWLEGIKTTQKVFQEAGTYKIYMADNLETEPENTFFYELDIILKEGN